MATPRFYTNKVNIELDYIFDPLEMFHIKYSFFYIFLLYFKISIFIFHPMNIKDARIYVARYKTIVF